MRPGGRRSVIGSSVIRWRWRAVKTMRLKTNARCPHVPLHWIIGFLAFLWILLRSGTNPKRLTYPCQRAAMPLAAGWLLALATLFSGSYFLRRFTRISVVVLMAGGVTWLVATMPQPSAARAVEVSGLPYWQVPNPLSKVFVLDSLPPTTGSLAPGNASVPDAYLSDPAIDTMVLMLATEGVFIHRTAAHPTGIVGADNVVIIKGNFQWDGRNTTSTDRIKG